MAAGVFVIHSHVVVLGSCISHSQIFWQGRQPWGTGSRTLGKMLWASCFAAWFPLQTTPHLTLTEITCCAGSKIKGRFAKERILPGGRCLSFPFQQEAWGGGRCLKRGWAPAWRGSGWAAAQTHRRAGLGVARAAPGAFVSPLKAWESSQQKQSRNKLVSMCCQALLFRRLQMGTTWIPK